MKILNIVRALGLAGSLLLQFTTLCFQSHGAAGDVDLSFDPGSGVNGTVNCLVVQPDGKVIIGGEFSTVQGLVRKSIARLNPDGSGDSSFNGDGSLASAVLALALQPDGKVLVGGESENFGLTRLNSDGSPDTIFNANAYAAIASTEPYYPARVSTIVVQPDGRVLYAGETLLRLHSDGTLDTGFISGAVGSVYSMAIQADEKLIVGGYLFNSVTGESRYGLARLNADGSLDDTFNGEAGNDGLFYAIVPQPDGKILVGGGFIAVNGTSDGTIARLNVDGSLDPTFGVISGTGAGGTRGSVNAIALQSDGAFIVGGQFEFIDGSARKNLARLNADGSLDASYPNGAGGAGGFPTGYPGTSVKAVVAWTDGSVFIGGAFTTVHGTNRNRVARLQSDGSVENGFQPGRGLERAVTAFIVQSDGKVVIGGGSSAMARLNADGSRDSDFSSGAGPNADVTSVALQPDGKLLIGGSFTAIDGTPRMALARLNADGALDADFDAHLEIQIGHDPIPQPYGGEYSTAVTKVLVQADGKILVAGYSLTSITGQEVFAVTARYFLERLDSDGNHDPAFAKAYGDAFDGGGYWSYSWYSYPASALVVQPDGKIVLSGVFNSLDGKNHKGIARLNADGDLDESFIPGSEFHLAVASLALQADGKILAGGGYFGNVNGVETYGIVRFNANGSLDSTFNPGTGIGPWWTGQVSSIALQPDGKVLIAGSFATFDGTNRNGVARINADGTLDFRFDPGTGANGGIASIALLPKGNILIGGNFLAVNGFLGPHVARLFGNDPPSPMGPEIVIEHPLGSRLQDGMANVDFGSVKPGLETERTITIRSIGLTDLTDLLITIDGANAEEFSVASEPASSIPGPDGIGTFTVHFAPLARGPQSAVLHLVSNDDDESPFDIALTGAGENRPPVAAIDSGSTPYATAIDLDVLANDNDPDFDALAITEAANGVNGTATIVDTEAGQRLRYAPGVRFSGVDQLNYTVSDGMGGIAEGTVHVTVARPLEAVVQTLYSTGVTGTNQNPGDVTWKTFGVASIASNGRVAFTGTLSGPHERYSVVVLGSSRGSEFSNAADYVVAQTGGYVFDDPGVKFASFKDPLLNDSGTVVFLAKFKGKRSGNGSGIIRHYESERNGVFRLVPVAFTNEESAGVPGARWKAFTSLALSDGALGEELIAFTAKMSGNVSKADDTGLWLMQGNVIELALREGTSILVDGTPTTVRKFVALQAIAGAAGQGHGATASGVLTRVKLDGGAEAVLRVAMDETGPVVSTVAMSGDGIEGGGESLVSFSMPTQSSDGRPAFVATLSGSGRDSAIFRGDGSDLELILRSRDPASTDDAAVFQEFESLANGSAGRVAFTARLTGNGIGGRNDTGIWLRDDLGLHLIAREGMQPPGVPAGARWAGFPSLALPDGSAGPLFVGKLEVPAPGQPNPAGIHSSNSLGVWAVDSSGVLRLIVRTGDAFDAGRKIMALALLSTVRGSPTQTRGYTATGELIYRVTLNDGSQHIVTVALP